MVTKLKNNYLSTDENIDKLKHTFSIYFIEKPDTCIKIMNKWGRMFNDFIKNQENM
jgi:hypothetical protein